VIELADLGDGASLTAFFAALLGPAATVTFQPTVGLLPAILLVTTPTYALCFVGGTQDAQQFALQAFESFLSPATIGEAVTSPQWNTVADEVFGILAAAGVTATLPIFLGGYSYGAASQCAMVQRILAATPNRKIRWFTYGMPKATSAAKVDVIRDVPGIHIHNNGDLIPQLPLSWVEGLWVLGLIGGVIQLAWSKWTPMPIYLTQDADGTKRREALPGLTFDIVLPLITELMTFGEVDPILPHRLREYVRRACLACSCPDFPFPDDAWRIIFPFGCNEMALELDALLPAPGELVLEHAFPPVPQLLLESPYTVATGELVLEHHEELTPELVLETPYTVATGDLVLSGDVVKQDRLELESIVPATGELVLMIGGDCPCCATNPTPPVFSVRVICPAAPFHNQVRQLTREILIDGTCRWLWDGGFPGPRQMQLISDADDPSPHTAWNFAWDLWQLIDPPWLTPDVFTCSPFYFEFSGRVTDFVSEEDVTFVLESVP